MKNNDKIRDEKLHYDIDSDAAKLSALSSGKIHKYKYVTGEEILLSNQKQIIGQVELAYSFLEKALEKPTQNWSVALKSLDTSNKKDKFNKTEGIFPHNPISYLIFEDKQLISIYY